MSSFVLWPGRRRIAKAGPGAITPVNLPVATQTGSDCMGLQTSSVALPFCPERGNCLPQNNRRWKRGSSPRERRLNSSWQPDEARVTDRLHGPSQEPCNLPWGKFVFLATFCRSWLDMSKLRMQLLGGSCEQMQHLQQGMVRRQSRSFFLRHDGCLLHSWGTKGSILSPRPLACCVKCPLGRQKEPSKQHRPCWLSSAHKHRFRQSSNDSSLGLVLRASQATVLIGPCKIWNHIIHKKNYPHIIHKNIIKPETSFKKYLATLCFSPLKTIFLNI